VRDAHVGIGCVESKTPEVNPFAPPRADVDDGVRVGGEGEMGLAGRGARLAAFLLDALVAAVILMPLSAYRIYVGVRHARSGMVGDAMPLLLFSIVGLTWLIYIGVQAYLVSTCGQSLGKRWLRIKIVKMDGSPVGFLSGVLLRSWLMGATVFIPYVNAILMLLNPLLIFRADKRCLHDHVAGTKVVALG
jgi:uncharacterized RDD family membrane protein YckC